MLSFYWTPDEIDVTKDKIDFNKLTKNEQHIFTSNLKRQILLDSVQGRSPDLALLPLASNPELELLIETWAFFETIHSRSYTHVIRNTYILIRQRSLMRSHLSQQLPSVVMQSQNIMTT